MECVPELYAELTIVEIDINEKHHVWQTWSCHLDALQERAFCSAMQMWPARSLQLQRAALPEVTRVPEQHTSSDTHGTGTYLGPFSANARYSKALGHSLLH